MKDGTKRYIETVNYLAKLYDYCNEKLFGGELVKPVITVQQDPKNKTNGWWSVKKVWKWQDKAPANCADCTDRDCDTYSNCIKIVEREEHELNMTAQQLNRSINQIAATMIHEMCHQYASVHGMQDTSRAGNYHNKLFKKIAETHGLTVECMPTIGWSHTELTDETAALIAKFDIVTPYSVIYRLPVMKGQCVKTSSTRKYICPICGNSVRATKVVRIMCVDCNELMQEEL